MNRGWKTKYNVTFEDPRKDKNSTITVEQLSLATTRNLSAYSHDTLSEYTAARETSTVRECAKRIEYDQVAAWLQEQADNGFVGTPPPPLAVTTSRRSSRARNVDTGLKALAQQLEQINAGVEAKRMRREVSSKKIIRYKQREETVQAMEDTEDTISLEAMPNGSNKRSKSANRGTILDPKVQFKATFNARIGKDKNGEDEDEIKSTPRQRTTKLTPTRKEQKSVISEAKTRGIPTNKRSVSRATRRDTSQASQTTISEKSDSPEKSGNFTNTSPTTMPELPTGSEETTRCRARSQPSKKRLKDSATMQRQGGGDGESKDILAGLPSSKKCLYVALVACILCAVLWIGPIFIRHLADPTGMMATGKFIHALSQEFPAQDASIWQALRHRLNTRGEKTSPQILIALYKKDASETAACLVSRIAQYVRDFHGDQRIHVLDVETLDRIADTQHLHVPLFFHFALEKDHTMVLINAHKLKPAGATQLKPLFNKGTAYKQPAAAFLLAIVNGTYEHQAESAAKEELWKQWLDNGWPEATVKEFLNRMRSASLYIVPEQKIPCSDLNFDLSL